MVDRETNPVGDQVAVETEATIAYLLHAEAFGLGAPRSVSISPLSFPELVRLVLQLVQAGIVVRELV